MVNPESIYPALADGAACGSCGSALADQQRYCLSCGTRRGPLPPAISGLIDAAAGRAREKAGGGGQLTDQPPGGRRAPDLISSLPPRAAAVAVMAMLAFGTVVGTGANALANGAGSLLVAVTPSRPATGAPPAVAAAQSPSGPSGATASGTPPAHPVVTVRAPAQTAQTVTAPASTSTGSSPATTPAPAGPALPPIKHVFVIMLTNQGYQQTYGPRSPARYLNRTLRKQGELLADYYAVAPSSLANAIALVSGQGPTPQTIFNCPTYTNITPGRTAAQGQVLGSGCVYPSSAQTLADQLTGAGFSWRAYVEGIGDGPAGMPKTCRHPLAGSPDGDLAPRPGDPYVTWRNPFVYFQSLSTGTSCARSDVALPQLAHDLRSGNRTPSLVYIVPSPCDDGEPTPCAPGKPAGLQAADAFLGSVVPEIERSAAYKAGGLIAITSDHAPQGGPHADPSACCNNPAYPNLSGAATPGPPATTTTTTSTAPASTGPASTGPASTTPGSTTTSATTPTTSTTATTTTATTTTGTTPTTPANGQTTPTGGGGQVGLLLLSRYVKPGTLDNLNYFNHFSLLSSIEALFSLRKLGYAKDPALAAFDRVTYNAYHG